MDGKGFVFDLQRFAAVTVSETTSAGTTTYTVGDKTITEETTTDNKKTYKFGEEDTYNSLEDAVFAIDSSAKFFVTKTKTTTTGEGDNATTTTEIKYYTEESDFKAANLTTTESGAKITAINIYGDVTLTGETSVTTQITVEKENVTLDLGANNLTINNADSGIYVKNGASLTVSGTGSIKHNHSGIYYPTDDASSQGTYITDTIKKKRLEAAIQLGDKDQNNREGVELTISSGVTVKGNNSALAVGNGSKVNLESGSTVESTYSCGIYVGNKKEDSSYLKASDEDGTKKLNDDIELNISGTVKSAETSNLPALQVSGTLSYNTTTINITGGTIEYANTDSLFGYENDKNKSYGNPDAIYAGGNTTINMSSGTITSGGTGVELRAGNLNVTGGTITSTATSYKVNTNAKATSGGQVYGAAVALSQHVTGKSVKTTIDGADTKITGQVALAVENAISLAEGASNTIEAEIAGGTFESTGTDAAAIAAKAADSRSTIKITGSTTFIGTLESTVAQTSESSASNIQISENAVVTVEKRNEDGTTTVVEKYDSNSLTFTEEGFDEEKKAQTLTYPVNKGNWYKGQIHSNLNTVYFLEKTETNLNAVANAKLAPKEVTYTQEGGTGTSTSLSATDLLFTVEEGLTQNSLTIDMTDEVFGGLSSTFTLLDASKVTKDGVKLNITGNEYLKKIIGGEGKDTLTAGSIGVSLHGGKGNDLLNGGDGADTFIFTAGADSITGYKHGTDIVSLGSGLIALTSFDNVSYNGSDYVISLGGGSGDSLTFKAKSIFSLKTADGETFSYTPGSIVAGDGVTIGSSYYKSKTFNGASNANADFVTIDAVAVEHAIRVTGNDNPNYIVGSKFGGTLLGGDGDDKLVAGSIGAFLNGQDGADSLVGGEGNDTFAYTGGNDTIKNYTQDQDLVSVAAGINVAAASVSTDAGNLILDFDGEKLTFAEGKDSTISLKSGRRDYLFSASSITSGKGVTLTANHAGGTFSEGDAYNTINAALVEHAISITGNDNGNYIVGGKSGGSLVGLAGNDTLVGGDGKDIFRYDSGKDVILGFNGTADSLSIDAPETNIAKARASNRRLTFTMSNKDNTLVFRSDDSIPPQISLTDGGYLTTDGVVNGESLKLFSSAKGRIDLNDTLYSGANISLASAENVKNQSVTLVGSASGGAFTFADKNKKRDGFEYGGGAVSISGYESGKDRINLGNESISGFSINGDDVMISLGGGGTVSLQNAKDSEVMIHQSTNRGNSYSRMVFAQDGVVYDKVKATSATLSTGAGGDDNLYSATNMDSIRKIKVDSGVSAISIQAGNKNNTQIDASLAGAVSLISGAKNDKFTGSSNADMFVYTGGKDIFQSFGEADSISLDNNLYDAKITAGKKSVRFKFGSKDTLTIKPTKNDTLSGELTINGKDRTYGKNSIAESGSVSLTSKFGGTYKIDGVSTVDGRLVEKKLTFKVTTAETNETLYGGKNKTTFKGGGGTDSLVGGSGDDIFFYARGDAGTATIADFDFSNDKLKIAGGTLAKVSTIDGGVRFGMKNGKGESPEVGWFDVKTSATYDDDDKSTLQVDGSKVLIKTNNTYYWFAAQDVTEEVTTEGGNGSTVTLAKAGELITWDKKVSSSDVKNHDSAVIELNYGTNLVRAGVAVAVSKDNDKATLPT